VPSFSLVGEEDASRLMKDMVDRYKNSLVSRTELGDKERRLWWSGCGKMGIDGCDWSRKQGRGGQDNTADPVCTL